jgi:putative peptidoglycan lipid II flippase
MARVFALLREMILASEFGASFELDAVFLGMALPGALIAAGGGGLARASVAVAASLPDVRIGPLARVGTSAILRHVLPLSIFLALAAPLWVQLFRIGEGSPPWALVAIAAAIGSLALTGGCLSGYYSGLCNARGLHVWGSSNILAYNATVCGALWLAAPVLGIYAVPLAFFLAEWLQSILLLPPLQRFLAPGAGASAEWERLRGVAVPGMLLSFTLGLNLTIDRAFATLLPEGSIAALSYAERLINLPVGLLATALAVPLFTRLSRFHDAGNHTAYADTMQFAVRSILLIGAPIALAVAIQARPFVGLLLERGAFGERPLDLTCTAMAGYAVGVPFQAMTVLLTSIGLLGNRAWQTTRILIGCTVLNAVCNGILAPTLGILGIALATSIVAVVRTVLLLATCAPTVLRARGVDRTFLSLTILLAVLIPALLFCREITAWTGLGTTPARVLSLALAGAAIVLAGLATWPIVGRREWTSLTALRRRVAEGSAIES